MTADKVTQARQRKGPDGLRALDRAVTILYMLAEHPRGLSLADLSRETGLTTTTAHRMLAALKVKELVRETPEGLHALGIGTLMLSGPYLQGLDLRNEIRPHLEELNISLNEACHVGVLASPHIVYIDKLDSTHPMRMASKVGATMPAVRTAMGKALLAELSSETVNQALRDSQTQLSETVKEGAFLENLVEVRRRGYALDLEENERGICCVGAALKDDTGRAVAALSVSGPKERMTEKRLSEVVAQVKSCARTISEALGHLPQTAASERRQGLISKTEEER